MLLFNEHGRFKIWLIFYQGSKKFLYKLCVNYVQIIHHTVMCSSTIVEPEKSESVAKRLVCCSRLDLV